MVQPDSARRVVGDAVLKDIIRQVREALEDDAASPRYIETAHRRGYRFIGEISEEAARDTVQPAHLSPPSAPASYTEH